jgi:hypothetical protein
LKKENDLSKPNTVFALSSAKIVLDKKKAANAAFEMTQN